MGLVVDNSAYDVEGVKAVWLAIGAKEPLALAMAAINLRWERGSLRAHENLLEEEDPVGYVCDLITAAYVIRPFSTSRFLGIGRCAAGLTSAMLVGLDAHIEFARKSGKASEWYIHCVDLLDRDARFFTSRRLPCWGKSRSICTPFSSWTTASPSVSPYILNSWTAKSSTSIFCRGLCGSVLQLACTGAARRSSNAAR